MSPTRRTVLRAALPAAVGLAGCSGRDSPTEARGAGPAGADDDPAVHKPRNPEGGPVVASIGGADRPAPGRALITERATAEAVEFASGVPEAAAQSTRAFLAATDFSAETVFLTEVRVESCYRYRIHSVSWAPGRVEYAYCRQLRPPTARCEHDATETVGLFFRIPALLEREVTSMRASGHAPCRDSDVDWAVIDATATSTEAPDP